MPRYLRQRSRHLAVTSQREKAARRRHRTSNENRDHVEDDDQLDEPTYSYVRKSSARLGTGQHEQRSRTRRTAERLQVEVETRNLCEGADDVEARDNEHRGQHRARNIAFGFVGLFGEVGRRLKPREEQHPVEHAKEHALQARRRAAERKARRYVMDAAALDDDKYRIDKTTVTEMSARVSCTRVDSATPR